MSIGKRLAPLAEAMFGARQEDDLEVEIVEEGIPGEQEDGSIIIDFGGGMADPAQAMAHGANLATVIPPDKLSDIATELIDGFEADKLSRAEWEETYVAGLDQLGLKIEQRDKPWAGACGVFHPLLAESVVEFQAQTSQEIFPSSGPVKTTVIGESNVKRMQQAKRVQDYLNYTCNETIEEYFDETEMLLMVLPLAGSAFRKIYHDEELGRPCAMFVPVEEFVVANNATNLSTCERMTHIMTRSYNWVRQRQVSGFYRDIDLNPNPPESSDIQDKKEELSGVQRDHTLDEDFNLLEMHVLYDLPGFEHKIDGEPTGISLPYVITLDKDSMEILAIRRNWREGDPKYKRRDYFTHWKYLPGFGFYGLGLVHMIGGLAKTATSLLRQLVDAGTLANLQGGFKTRTMGTTKGDNSPIMPGEFRDVDIPMGRIQDNIYVLPFKEPSSVLYQLLIDIVEQGRRFASAAEIKASDMNGEAPVGTTLAILERSLKVISAVQRRLHRAMGRELKMLAELVRSNGPREYPYDVGGNFTIAEDFDERVDVIPVSDPNAGTMAQRIMQYQAALQLSATSPQMYDMPRLHRSMLEVLGIEEADKIVPTDQDLVPTDPVTENMHIINGKPVKAFQYQDHEAHLQVHTSLMQHPQIQASMKDNPKARAIQGAMMDHIAEHVAFAYRQHIEKELGVPLPPPDEPLPEDIETRLAQLVAPAAAQLTGKAQQQAQAEENAKKQEDPVVQIQQRELKIKEDEQKSKDRERQERLRQQREKAQGTFDLENRKLAAKVAADLMDAAEEKDQRLAKEQKDGFELGMRIAQMAMQQVEQQRGGNNES